MKNRDKIKLGIAIIAIMTVLAGGIAIFQLSQATALTLDISKQKARYIARQCAHIWDNKIDGYIKVLQALSNVMNFYENLSSDARRREYENTMQAVFEDMPEFIRLFTIWKPDAIDGMDNRFIGRPGSTPTGQFAFNLTRENGQIEKQTSDAVQVAMAHLSGQNSKKVEMSDPSVIKLTGKDIWGLKIMVPIINKRLNESVGVIGCQFNIDIIQPLVEKTIKEQDEVSIMAIYTDTGFILANYIPDLIGKQLINVETQYGEHLGKVVYAVKNAQEYECSSYDPEMKSNMNMIIVPIPLTASPTTWAVMIGSNESYVLREINAIKLFVIILMSIASFAAMALVYLIIRGNSKPRQRKRAKKHLR
jgi:methyl-accepting chemotaxis protein